MQYVLGFDVLIRVVGKRFFYIFLTDFCLFILVETLNTFNRWDLIVGHSLFVRVSNRYCCYPWRFGDQGIPYLYRVDYSGIYPISLIAFYY